VRVQLFPGGLVDDLAGHADAINIERIGDARYSMSLTASSCISIEIWTTRKDRILATALDRLPEWVALAVGSEGELVSMSATDCNIHLEHLDRPTYFLGLSRDDEHWALQLGSRGYIKVRPVPDATK
jgi:hypothetical protein